MPSMRTASFARLLQSISRKGSEVRIEPQPVGEPAPPSPHLSCIYELLNQSEDTGDPHLSERHDEHQPWNPVFLSHSKPDGALTHVNAATGSRRGRRARVTLASSSRASRASTTAEVAVGFPVVLLTRQGHRAEGHAASAEGRHEIAAGLAVVVAVDGAAVGVGEVGRNDLESIALREVRLGRGQQAKPSWWWRVSKRARPKSGGWAGSW